MIRMVRPCVGDALEHRVHFSFSLEFSPAAGSSIRSSVDWRPRTRVSITR